MNIKIIPCSLEHIEKLIEGEDAFLATYGLQVIDEYLPFAEALQYTQKMMQTSQIWHPWLAYLFLFEPDRALVGLGGFKSVPNPERTI